MSHTILKYGQYAKRFLDNRGALCSGGELHGLSVTYKFGHNDTVGTSYVVVSEGGLCNTPLPANATTLRIKAGGNVNDVAGGSGARQIVLEGLDETGAEIVELLATNGISASLSTVQTFMRLNRAIVTETGTYSPDLLGGGQAATIIIENTAGTADWMRIQFNGFADCQSQSSCHSVGTGKRVLLSAINIFVDATKAVDFVLAFRSDFMQLTPGFQPVRLGAELNGIEGAFTFAFREPARFYQHTDIAILAKVASGTAKVSANLTYIENSNGSAVAP